MRPARSSEEGFKICADAEFFRRQEGVACVWRERWSGSAAAQRISPSATRPSRDLKRSRLPSALRPTLARGVPLSVEFQARRGLNFPGLTTFAAFRRKRARRLVLTGGRAEHAFQRNYKTDRRGLSITILHRLTSTVFKVYVVFLDCQKAVSRNGRTQQGPCLRTESVSESGRLLRLFITADALRGAASESSLRLTRVLLHAPNES